MIAVEKLGTGKDPSLADNYRPISLLSVSVCYKLLGHLALQHISPIVEGLLSPDQAPLLTVGWILQMATAAVWLGR